MPEQGNAITQQDLLSLFMQTGKTEDIKLNQGLLSGDQKGFMDVLRNPDQAQVSALVGGLAGAVNPRGRDPALMGIAQGAQAFQGARQQEYDNKIKAEELRQDQLKNRLQGALGIGKFIETQGQNDITNTLASDKFTNTKLQQKQSQDNIESAASKTGTFTLNGNTLRGKLDRKGRSIVFDNQGNPTDITSSGAVFSPDSTQNISAHFNSEGASTKARSKRFQASIDKAIELVPEATSTLAKVESARQLNAQNITGAFGELRGNVGKTMQFFAEMSGAEIPQELLKNNASRDSIKAHTQEFVRKRFEATKGAISDREFRAFNNSVFNVENTELGNEMFLNFEEATARRAIENASFLEEWDANYPDARAGNALKTWGQYINDFPATTSIEGNFSVNHDNMGMFELYLENKGRPSFQGSDGQPVSIPDLVEYAREHNLSTGGALSQLIERGHISGQSNK